MPCYKPKQVGYKVLPTGKKELSWSPFDRSCTHTLDLPCNRCIGCRLKHSREWGIRCMHESKMHEENSFLTLTFSPEGLAAACPNGSVSKEHIRRFMKDLRNKLRFLRPGLEVKYYGCGEYGDQFGRPHYHICLFGYDFPDKRYFGKSFKGFSRYISKSLDDIWSYGNCSIGDLCLETASYTARYCLKKISGAMSKAHYGERHPEFSAVSKHPGIGYSWYQKWFDVDVVPHNCCIVNGQPCYIPKYYLDLWKDRDPAAYEAAKIERMLKAQEISLRPGPSLESKERCVQLRLNKEVRLLEAL